MKPNPLQDNVSNLVLHTSFPVLGKCLGHITIRTTVLLDLLRSATNESRRIKQGLKLRDDRLKELGRTNALDQVVGLSLELDSCGGLVREHADLLVGVLARNSLLDERHDDVLGGHEWQLLHNAVLNALGVHDQSAEDVVHQDQQGVGAEVHLGDIDAADGRVVQGALHPLRRVGRDEVCVQVPETAAEGGETLGAHGVALVGHGGAADLVLLEGLFDFLPAGKMSDVCADALAGGAEAADGACDFEVDFAAVGLGGDWVRGGEAGLLGDELVKSLDFVVVAVEDLKETSLGSGGSLDSTEAELVAHSLQSLEVHQEVLDPDTGSLADSHQLSLGGWSAGFTADRLR